MNNVTTCDWCEKKAVVKTQKDGSACKEHLDELEVVVKLRIADSGNPFAGEAAESLIADALYFAGEKEEDSE